MSCKRGSDTSSASNILSQTSISCSEDTHPARCSSPEGITEVGQIDGGSCDPTADDVGHSPLPDWNLGVHDACLGLKQQSRVSVSCQEFGTDIPQFGRPCTT